ncbi:PAK4-inhibitor INKA2-like isoform X1 [Paramisgurnus dabryanus]|uniref:PAK4-inhibitor INKA2-like isoform X1 n=2 Tax=Paramisgurnus dabryanus TaxID=90735 RepID=UPI0031F3CBC9
MKTADMDGARKNMDTCLRRLKQELSVESHPAVAEHSTCANGSFGVQLSMKEAGDGLHDQMNCMMGALQELKLLQVQTALEQLKISGNTGCMTQSAVKGSSTSPDPDNEKPQSVRTFVTEDQHPNRSSLGTSPSLSSLGSESVPLPKPISGYTAPQVEYCGPKLGHLPVHHSNQQHLFEPEQQEVDLPGILYSLSREGPSLDSDCLEDTMDDSSDWTSSLMSQSRNRQPLVLGDNVFADLVGNWLDLPELEKDLNRSDFPAHPLRLSRSQELCKRFSLTTNIFKKFLRSVRPDRDKLLKEKPGWMPPDLNPEAELFKRPKKAAKSRGGFYLPFWAGGQLGKGQSCPPPTEKGDQFLELNIDSKTAPEDKVHPLFDYNTAVWV